MKYLQRNTSHVIYRHILDAESGHTLSTNFSFSLPCRSQTRLAVSFALMPAHGQTVPRWRLWEGRSGGRDLGHGRWCLDRWPETRGQQHKSMQEDWDAMVIMYDRDLHSQNEKCGSVFGRKTHNGKLLTWKLPRPKAWTTGPPLGDQTTRSIWIRGDSEFLTPQNVCAF